MAFYDCYFYEKTPFLQIFRPTLATFMKSESSTFIRIQDKGCSNGGQCLWVGGVQYRGKICDRTDRLHQKLHSFRRMLGQGKPPADVPIGF